MSEVQLRGIYAGYGEAPVLGGVGLTVASGSTTAVLGDSGSGKTTLLRVIAGFLRPSAGTVTVGNLVVADGRTFVPPERRGIGYVRQDGGLFPHLSVAANIAFGLPRTALARRDRKHRDRVAELLELVELPQELADRRPDQLSGGQQQRVALARALAPRPDLVLLDEPFSSLDTALRAMTREATARALRAAGATAVLVTHDQGEALSVADEVAILRHGQFRQIAAPRTVYGQPVDAQIASFLGDAVVLPGVCRDGHVESVLGSIPLAGPAPHGQVQVFLRPEQLTLAAPTDQHQATWRVTRVSFYGHDAVVELSEVASAEAIYPETSARGNGGVSSNGWGDAATAETPLRARVLGHAIPEIGEQVAIEVVGAARILP